MILLIFCWWYCSQDTKLSNILWTHVSKCCSFSGLSTTEGRNRSTNNQEIMVSYKKNSTLDRERIIEAFKNEEDWRALARTLVVNPRTAYHWLRNDQPTPKTRGRATTKKTPEIAAFITRCVEGDSAITLKQLKERLATELDVNVCVNTVKNWLDLELFSVKLARPMIANVNLQCHKIARAIYVEKLYDARSSGRTIIWLDETNYNLYCRLGLK